MKQSKTTTPSPSIPVKDEVYAADIEDGINADFNLCQRIAGAYNCTYGKGYNPAAMEELYKAVNDFIKANFFNPDIVLFDSLQKALTNSKL